MRSTMFKQQIIGIINLSVPIIILFKFSPDFVFSLVGTLFCSALTGIYICYLNGKIGKNMIRSLKYSPTSQNLEKLTKLIVECNVDPKSVTLNYAYTNEMIAMATFNNIIIDPIVWSGLDEDPEALKVKDIFNQAIEPTLSPRQKSRLDGIKEVLSAGAQRFIFKHELGHVFHNFSNRNLGIICAIGMVSTYIGIMTASKVMCLGGIVAIIAGMFAGGISDLLFSYTSNILFKSNEEKKADMFAARYSSPEDIKEAADFFERHQAILDKHQEPGTMLPRIPSIITTGHPNGRSRAFYLHKIAEQKTSLV